MVCDYEDRMYLMETSEKIPTSLCILIDLILFYNINMEASVFTD